MGTKDNFLRKRTVLRFACIPSMSSSLLVDFMDKNQNAVIPSFSMKVGTDKDTLERELYNMAQVLCPIFY